MDPRYEARRLGDVGNALRMARTLAAQERLPRERIGGGPVALERLPS